MSEIIEAVTGMIEVIADNPSSILIVLGFIAILIGIFIPTAGVFVVLVGIVMISAGTILHVRWLQNR